MTRLWKSREGEGEEAVEMAQWVRLPVLQVQDSEFESPSTSAKSGTQLCVSVTLALGSRDMWI